VINKEWKKKEFRELVSKLSKLALIASEVANSVPEEYKKETFIETYRYLLTISQLKNGHAATQTSTKEETTLIIEDSKQVLAPTVTASSSEIRSPTEFINIFKIKPKAFPEWITAFAYYMKYYKGKKTFQPKDVKDCFRQAGLSIPKNLPRDTKVALKKGYLALDPDSKNTYYITRKGEELIRGMLSGQTKQE